MSAATNDLTSTLQRGLFEEEANRNLDAAAQAYQMVSAQFDKDRKLAATAIFRLGEIYRKQNKTNEAAAQYERIVREFADQDTLVTLSRQNLAGLNAAKATAAGSTSPSAITEVRTTPTTDEEEKEIRRIQAMIRNSPDLINSPGEGGATPLHTAARQGQLTVARFLLDSGANANSKDGQGRTPLMVAASAGHKSMVELLLSNGAEVDIRNGGRTALHLAANYGYGGVAEVLLANKADVNADENNGATPLQFAAAAGHSAMAELLLAKGAKVDAMDNRNTPPGKRGQTPLMEAARNGHAAMVKILLSARANPDAQNEAGRTALSQAAENKHLEVVKTLLDGKANPNAGDVNTPLAMAVYTGHIEITESLLRHGADPNLESKLTTRLQLPTGGSIGGFSSGGGYGPYVPLQIAISRSGVEMVKLLLKYKADANAKEQAWYSPPSPLVFYALNISAEMLKAFLDGGADPDSKNGPGIPLLVLAAQSDAARLEPLVTRQANVNVRDEHGYTPLHMAARRGDEKSVQLLLAAKADVNARGWGDGTPLHSAVASGNLEVVQLLLANKADVNVRDNSGQTPLDLAKSSSAPRSPFPPSPVPAPGGATTIPAPARVIRQPTGAESPAKEEPGDLAGLLRQHGALDDLPDFITIRVTRQGVDQPIIVFRAHTNGWNQFNLLETVMGFYARSQARPGAGNSQPPADVLPFPDLGRLIIRRPSPKPGGKEKEIKVSLLNSSNRVDCANNVPLEFGDIVEIPERVHALNETSVNPLSELESLVNSEMRQQQPGASPGLTVTNSTTGCLYKTVNLVILGETTSITAFAPREGWLRSLLQKPAARSVLRSSSDLSRVKVTRKDPITRKFVELIVDDGNPSTANLWLRDGDVIEVPEKP